MFNKTGQSPDTKLLVTIVVLIIFGWILSFSASLAHFDSYSYVRKQGFYIVLGLIVGFFVLKTPLSFFKLHSRKLFIFSLILLGIVLLPDPIGFSANGARRWINFVVFKFQPSEMMKLAMILFMAGFLIRQEKEVTGSLTGIGKTLLIVASSGLLTMLETDLGATIIITITALSMLFIAGSYIKELLMAGAGILGGLALYVFYDPTRLDRWLSFWMNDLWGKDGVHQTQQALIGIGRGDWTGTGLGAGIQKYTKLPESHTDMIFAIIGEELGIIGMLFVLFSFAYIINKGFSIAKEALKHGRKYSSYVAFGICTWFSMQVGVNIAMNLGLIPIKGFTLPLISYGGSSMIFSIIALAIILRIDMENRAPYSKQRDYV
ncbi:MAG TPA: cell cycle protein [Gammaproteobacteria bacterium]|nr:cell cycle protein [Gammaproteobacteria bacterium]HAO44239.1 cell cycle protein [Gammaproteobacteria bacterium]HAO90255.1 cell cycle protein [Gammaproteobacteria bacterium]HAO97847.1 cell cycle protein [Gammaproteobacteria bacterium]HBG03811.1 cell cycle protein [Gammaproteobacteria bacterium]